MAGASRRRALVPEGRPGERRFVSPPREVIVVLQGMVAIQIRNHDAPYVGRVAFGSHSAGTSGYDPSVCRTGAVKITSVSRLGRDLTQLTNILFLGLSIRREA